MSSTYYIYKVLSFILINLARNFLGLKSSFKGKFYAFRCLQALDKINREYNTLRDGLNAISQVILI